MNWIGLAMMNVTPF